MLSAFTSTRSIMLFLAIALFIVHGQTISQLNSLENMRIGLSEEFYLDIYSMIRGPNLTFSISGSYTPTLPTTDIKIYQNLYLSYNHTKTKKSVQQQSYGSLQIDYYRKLLYTIDSPNINIWSLASFPELINVASYEVDINQGYTVVSMNLINFRMYPGKPLQRLAFTVDFKSNTYFSRVLNFTDLYNMTEIVELQIFRVIDNYNRVSYYQDNNYVWGFFYTENDILVYRYSMLDDLSVTLMYTITASTFGVSKITPVSINFYSKTGYYCDEGLGVYQLSLEFINSTSANFPITQKLYAPSTLGTLISCTINQGILTVDTDGGTALYTLPSLEQLIEFPQYTTYTNDDNFGMISNKDYTVGWLNTIITNNEERTSMRIYSSKVNFLDSLVIDLSANYILGTDLSNLNPSFTLYKPSSGVNTFVIINAAYHLLVYEIESGSYLYFPPQTVPYVFNGTLTAFDGVNFATYPVGLQGVDDNNTAIFYGKGNYQGQGYASPSSFSSYVLSSNDTVFTSYIPLSNYFSGPNITYTLDISKGVNSLDKLAVYTPSKYGQVSSNSITNTGELSYFQVFPVQFSSDILVSLSDDTLSLYLYKNLNLVSMFAYVFSDQLTPSVVTVKMLDKYYIVVECSGINNQNVYFTQWEVFTYKNNEFINAGTTVMLNRDPSSQILLTDDNLFYSLSGNSIDVFEFDLTNYNFTYSYSINEDSLYPTFDFVPVTFGIFDKFYVFDYFKGLLYIESTNSTIEFTAVEVNLTFPSSYDATMQSDQTALYLTVKGFNFSTIYVVPFTLEYSETLPNIHCDLPTDLSLSDIFYSQICTTGSNYYIQVFDAYADTYTALFTEVYPGTIGFFSLGSYVSYDAIGGYFTDGSRILSYYFGQIGNSSFNPTYPFDATPDDDKSQLIWSQVTLTFNDLYYTFQYNFELTLTATNNFGSAKTKLSYRLINSKNYIEDNIYYDITSNNFTSSQISLDKDYNGPIPLEAFNGNNIEYAFAVNGTSNRKITESASCDDAKGQFCIESKTYSIMNETGSFKYFDTWGSNLVATNSTHILLYTWTPTSFQLTKSILSSSLDFNTSCYQIEYLEGISGFAVYCSSIQLTGSSYFIVLLNSDLTLCSDFFNISYPVVFLTSSSDSTTGLTWIYYYQTTDITILQLNNSIQTCPYNFTLVAHITQNSLFANTPAFSFSVESFKPIDIYYYSSRVLIMIDEYMGIVMIEPSNYVLPYTFRLGYVLKPYTNILQVQNSKIVSSAYDSTGQGTVLLIMNTADVYKCAIYPYPRQQAHFPKISESAYVPLNKKATVIEEDTILIFPVARSSAGYLRFLNYSANNSNSVYREDYYGVNDNNTYAQRVVASSFYPNVYIHNFSPVNILDAGGPLVVSGLRTAPKGYIKKMNPQYNGTISLIGFIGEESDNIKQYPPSDYTYPYSGSGGSSSSNPFDVHTYRSSWNRWYFWFILGIFSLALLASIISIYLCISRRKSRAYSHMSIGLTTVNP